MTGCVHCGAYSPSLDGVCADCRAARDPARRARDAGRIARRQVRVRKRVP
jgi:NMD protein affecting ribosome stability and mRNA decay